MNRERIGIHDAGRYRRWASILWESFFGRQSIAVNQSSESARETVWGSAWELALRLINPFIGGFPRPCKLLAGFLYREGRIGRFHPWWGRDRRSSDSRTGRLLGPTLAGGYGGRRRRGGILPPTGQ